MTEKRLADAAAAVLVNKASRRCWSCDCFSLSRLCFHQTQGGDRRSPHTGLKDAVTRRWDHGIVAAQELGLETPPRACPEEGLACVGVRRRKRRMKMWIWPRYWPISYAEAK